MTNDRTRNEPGNLHRTEERMPKDHMGDADFRMKVLRHAMGFCILSVAVLLSLSDMALTMGYDKASVAMDLMASMGLFALMAGWRSHDLSSGRASDMGRAFYAYQRGDEVITRLVTRGATIVAIAESAVNGLIPIVPIVLLTSIAISEADKLIVIASCRGYEEQTIDKRNDQGSGNGE